MNERLVLLLDQTGQFLLEIADKAIVTEDDAARAEELADQLEPMGQEVRRELRDRGDSAVGKKKG